MANKQSIERRIERIEKFLKDFHSLAKVLLVIGIISFIISFFIRDSFLILFDSNSLKNVGVMLIVLSVALMIGSPKYKRNICC